MTGQTSLYVGEMTISVRPKCVPESRVTAMPRNIAEFECVPVRIIRTTYDIDDSAFQAVSAESGAGIKSEVICLFDTPVEMNNAIDNRRPMANN